MKRTTTLPFIPIDSGKALAQCAGLPLEEVGAMTLLMLYYWESGCRLPNKDWLTRRLRLKGKREEVFDRVIDDCFPDGINDYLDRCWANGMDTKHRNSANAKKGHEKRKAKEQEVEEIQNSQFNDDDF